MHMRWMALVGALMLHRYLEHTVVLTRWQLRVAVVLLLIGMGAIHELVEWFSTLVLGPKNGMLKTEGVYEFDTQRDMFDNLMGAIVAVSLYAWSRRARKVAPAPASPASENPEWRATAASLESGR